MVYRPFAEIAFFQILWLFVNHASKLGQMEQLTLWRYYSPQAWLEIGPSSSGAAHLTSRLKTSSPFLEFALADEGAAELPLLS